MGEMGQSRGLWRAVWNKSERKDRVHNAERRKGYCFSKANTTEEIRPWLSGSPCRKGQIKLRVVEKLWGAIGKFRRKTESLENKGAYLPFSQWQEIIIIKKNPHLESGKLRQSYQRKSAF